MPITISTNTTYSSIAGTYVNGDSITINSGAIFTFDVQPASGVYFGNITINEGKALVDGVNISGNNCLSLLFQETLTIAASRPGTWELTGKYYEVGTSNGTASQSFTLPFSTAISHCEVETSAGSGVYEVWGNLASRAFTDAGSVSILGNVCKQTMASTSLTFGNGTNGRIPPNGAKIRIYNVITGSTTTGSPTVPTLNSTASNRYETSITGVVKASKAYFSGVYLNLRFSYQLDFTDVGILGQALIEGIAQPLDWARVSMSVERTRFIGCQLDFADCNSFLNSENTLFTACTGEILGGLWLIWGRSTGEHCLFFEDASNNFLIDGAYLVGHGIQIANSINYEVKNCYYSDSTNGTENTTSGTSNNGVFFYAQQCSNILFDNLSIISGGTLPPRALVEAESSDGVVFQNWGTPTSPLNFNNRPSRLIQVFSSGNNVKNFKFKRIYLTNPQSNTTVISTLSPAQTGFIFQNVRFGAYNKALPLCGNNQLIKGSQFSSTFGSSGIPTSYQAQGCHFYDGFTSNTTGAVGLLFSEATADPISTQAYVIDAANPSSPPIFNGTGGIQLRTAGDRITYTRPYYVLGHSGISGVSSSLTGSYTIEYDLDKNDGNGFSGVWKAIADISAETVSATQGWREKLRFTANSSVSSNAILGYFIATTTTLATQEAAVYVDTIDVLITITNAAPSSNIRVYKYSASDANLILSGTADGSGNFSGTYAYSADVPVIVIARKFGYLPYNSSNEINGVITETGLNVFASMPVDPYV